MDERARKQLGFLVEIDQLKTIFRQNLLVDGSRRENDAEHSWSLAVMTFLLAEYAEAEVDVTRVMKMVLLHDLVEIDAGDTFAYDAVGYQDKEARELAAAERIFSLLPDDQAKEFRALWDEFEAMSTPSALYAAALDRMQPLINNYLTDGHTWKLHHVTPEQIFVRMDPIRRATPALWPLVELIVKDSLEKGFIPPNA